MVSESVALCAIILLSAITSLAALITLNAFVIGLSAALILASVMVFRLWGAIEAKVFRHTNLIQVFNGYELSGDRASAIKRRGDSVSATTAAVLGPSKDRAVEASRLEEVIAHINYPFRLAMQLERLNMDRILDGLQTRRSMKEIELSRAGSTGKGDTARMNGIKREIEQLEHDISSIRAGDVPLKISYYLMTNATSENLYDAEERAKSQIRELSSQFDALLGSKSQVVCGRDLLGLLELDSSMVLE